MRKPKRKVPNPWVGFGDSLQHPSIGFFVVTREMLQCLGRDTVKIHFEYNKRQTFAGAEACFEHA